MRSGCRAAHQPDQEGDLPPAPVGQRSGDEAAGQRHERERADNQPDSLVRAAEVMTHVWRERRQHRADAEKSEKCSADERPKARTQGSSG